MPPSERGGKGILPGLRGKMNLFDNLIGNAISWRGREAVHVAGYNMQQGEKGVSLPCNLKIFSLQKAQLKIISSGSRWLPHMQYLEILSMPPSDLGTTLSQSTYPGQRANQTQGQLLGEASSQDNILMEGHT